MSFLSEMELGFLIFIRKWSLTLGKRGFIRVTKGDEFNEGDSNT